MSDPEFPTFPIPVSPNLPLNQIFGLNWQPANPLPRCAENCVGYGRGDGGSARFANTTRRIRAWNDVGLDHRHLIHAQRLVIVEVRLLHSTTIDRDFPAQRRTQAIHDSTL